MGIAPEETNTPPDPSLDTSLSISDVLSVTLFNLAYTWPLPVGISSPASK